MALQKRIAAAPKRRRRFDLLPYGFVTPIVALLICVSFYPAFYAVYLAMTDASLLKLARAEFVGLRNVVRMAQDPIYLAGLWKTLRWDIAVVFLELSIALPIALFLNLNFRGRGAVRAIVLVPYILPPAVTALLWVFMFDGNFGVVNELLVKLGLIDNYYSWLSDPTASFWIIVFAMAWAGQPLMAIIILAALQTIPRELYEASEVDGAGRLSKFFHVTLPHIVPTLLFLILVRTIWMSNHIDMIYVMTRGGPGFANYTEAVYSFTLTTQFEIGYASAVAVSLALVLLAGAAFYVRHLARSVLA
jgi:multiple sugar transport system permease protein